MKYRIYAVIEVDHRLIKGSLIPPSPGITTYNMVHAGLSAIGTVTGVHDLAIEPIKEGE